MMIQYSSMLKINVSKITKISTIYEPIQNGLNRYYVETFNGVLYVVHLKFIILIHQQLEILSNEK